MYCPQCGTQSAADLKFCRSCGANLKVIGKAVTLSEAIARSDGLPAMIKASIGNIKLPHVNEEVSRAMDKMNKEITRAAEEHRGERRRRRREKTAEERRERHLTKGVIKLFWGGGLMVFLYFLAHSLVLKLPGDVIANTPFEIDPVVRMIWLIGLLPVLSGMGHILAGLFIRPKPAPQVEAGSPLRIEDQGFGREVEKTTEYDEDRTVVRQASPPSSVTDRTTNILDREPRTVE